MRSILAETMLSGYVLVRPEMREAALVNVNYQPSGVGKNNIRREVLFAKSAKQIEWENHTC